MSSSKIVRAWKDAEYRASLSETERSALPSNPAGLIHLSEQDLEVVAGGVVRTVTTFCPGGTIKGHCCGFAPLGL